MTTMTTMNTMTVHRRTVGSYALSVAVSWSCLTGGARADSLGFEPDNKAPQVFQVDIGDPERSVPDAQRRNASPVAFGHYLIELLEYADKAFQEADYAQAAKLYRALTIAVPDRATGFAKLCEVYSAQKAQTQAEEACATALTLAGSTTQDYVRYVHLVLGREGVLEEMRRHNVEAAIAHLRAEPKARSAAIELECLFAFREQAVPRLRACIASLRDEAHDPLQSARYEWRLALIELDRSAAERAVELGKEHGMQAEELQAMSNATRGLMHPIEKQLRSLSVRWRGVAVASIVCMLAVMTWLRRRRFTADVTTSR